MNRVPGDLDLTERTGLPADLRFLVDRFPRDEWKTHENLGSMAQFWLQRHAMFRDLGGMLTAGLADYREGRASAGQFAEWFAPRLQFFINQLFAHHYIEDEHYFPTFVRAESRLKRGFELLDSDHHILHDALEKNVRGARDLMVALRENEAEARKSADRYAGQTERLVALMMRHLEDEEDLIVPVILDQGERKLGLP